MKVKAKISNITAINAITSLLLQIMTIISGFIIPRLILKQFGSEVNGLISSLNQFLNYISLIEGGVSAVIMASLYKPLLNKDNERISSIVKTTQSCFKKIAIVFLVYSLLLAIIYPLVFQNSFSFLYISTLIIILSINIFIQYNFSLSWKLLLNADKKVYIVSIVQILLIILNIITFILLIKIYPEIHFLKLISALVFILQPIVYRKIINKYYKLDNNAPVDNELIKNRWDGFGINIAYFIHYNTDIAILTIFTDLKIVSIYAVYSLVATGLRQLIISISSGISPSLGHVYSSGNNEKMNIFFDRYEFIIMFITFICFSIGCILISPFVMIYTNGITDVNYYQPVFGILLLISEGIYCLRDPYVSFAYSAKKFKKITKHTYIEAGINILVSLILVVKFKLIGVAIGTILAMLYRAIFHIIYLKKDIIHRPIKKFIRNFSIFSIFTTISITICIFCFPIKNLSIINWLINGVIYFLIFIIQYIIMTYIFFKNQFNYYKEVLQKVVKLSK